MSKAEEYRKRAADCERLAATASPDIRKQYLQLARQWRDMAHQIAWMEAEGIRISDWTPK